MSVYVAEGEVNGRGVVVFNAENKAAADDCMGRKPLGGDLMLPENQGVGVLALLRKNHGAGILQRSRASLSAPPIS